MSCKCEGNTYHIGMGCCTPIVANADNYYTKSEVDEKLEEIVISGDGITSGEVQSMIDASVEPIEGSVEALSGAVEQLSTDMENKADKSDIPSLSGYATEQWVENKHYLTEHQSLSGYATEQWVENKGYLTEHQHLKTINNISLVGDGDIQIGTGGTTDLSNYYTKGETNDLLDDKLDASAYTPTDLSSYATKQWVENQGYLTEHQSLANYYNKSEVNSLLDDKLDASAYTPTDLSQYWTSAQTQSAITQSVSGYATQQWVQNQGYLTEHQSLSGYATTAETTNINNSLTAHTANTTVHVTQNEKNTWNSKADQSTTYTKTEVNNIVNNKFWCGTQAEYEALSTKDNNVLYLIHE